MKESNLRKDPSISQIWYARNKADGTVLKDSNKKPIVNKTFESESNRGLHALFWLSLDINSKGEIRESLDMSWANVDLLRHNYQHSYVKIQMMSDVESDLFPDAAKMNVSDMELEDIAMTALKAARSALIYIHMAVYEKESRNSDTLSGVGYSIPLLRYNRPKTE